MNNVTYKFQKGHTCRYCPPLTKRQEAAPVNPMILTPLQNMIMHGISMTT